MNSINHSSVPQTGQILYLGSPIKLLSNNIFTGCNIYHTSSVIKLRVDFGTLSEVTSALAGAKFPAAFLDRFGGLKSFVKKNGLKEDFITQLTSPEGVDFRTVLLQAILAVENSIAFAMHDLNTVTYAAIEKHKNYTDLIWECSVPKLSRHAAEVGLLGVLELLPKRYFSQLSKTSENFASAFSELQQLAHRRRLSPTTAVLKLAAKNRGLPCETLGRQHLLLGHGQAQHQLYSSMTSTTSITSQKICADKRLSSRRLAELRLPVPKQAKVGSAEAAHAAAAKVGFPIVIKPVKGKKGGGVTAGLTSPDGIDSAFERAHQSGSDVLIEHFEPGADHRLLVIGGKFVAALTRRPPSITGDGQSTVEALIDKLNAHPFRDGFRLFEVEKDTELYRLLRQADLTMSDILDEARTVTLRSAANVSTGGMPIDVTEQVHPDNRQMAERAANGVGVDVAGIDFLTTDISRSYREVGGAIVEIIARPDLCMHTWPLQGKSRNVAGEVLKLPYPSGTDGRIVIAAVAGDKGTGATARTLDMILRGAGKSVALALRSRAFVNGESAELTKTQQTQAPSILLRDPKVGILVSTVSPRQAARHGLLLDQCTLTVIMDKVMEEATNFFHSGLDIIKRATTDCFVVGAGNIVALDQLRDLGARNLILVSEHHNNPALQAHLNAGHTAVTTMWYGEEVRIVLVSGTEHLASFHLNIGSLHDGRVRRKRLKMGKMFAIAAAFGLGLSGSEIETAFQNAPAIVPDTI